MKKYEKPNLIVFSLVGNENLCGGCDNKLSKNENLNKTIAWLVGDDDNILTKEETSYLFGMGEECSKEVEGYCKFTSTAQNVAWS